MTPTTATTLRGQFRTAVEGITPTYAEHQDKIWRYTPRPDEVATPEMRVFTILAEPAEAEDPDVAVYGGGVSYSYTLQVMASYSDLPLIEDEAIVDEDARDLWLALDDVKASNTGLIDVSFPSWTTDASTEDGFVYGVFSFEVRYFGRNS